MWVETKEHRWVDLWALRMVDLMEKKKVEMSVVMWAVLLVELLASH